MAGGTAGDVIIDHDVQARREKLAGPPGFKGLVANPKVFFIALFASIGGLLYGYNQGVFSGILVMTNFHDHFKSNLDNSGLKGMMTSILELGAWVGSLANSQTAERFGRRGAIGIACVFFCIGVAIQTGAQNSAFIYCGRFITGLGVGSLSVGVPLLNAELAPPEVRGSLVTLQQLSIEFGILVSFWIDYGTNYIGGSGANQKESAWRVPLGLQLFPALILAAGILFLPESPRWLVNRGREDEALSTLAKLRGLPASHELVQIEILEVRAQHLFEVETLREKYGSLVDDTSFSGKFKLEYKQYQSIITNRNLFKRVASGAIVMFFQQWNGINAVLYYAPTIFQNLQLSGNTTNLLATGVVGIVMFIATFPTVIYLDSLGRKPVLIIGAIGMGVCHTIIAIIIGIYENEWPTHHGAGWAAVVFVWLYAIFFGFSWGPVAWVYIAEIFPLGIRSKAISVAASSNWMNNFIIGEITPTMLNHLKFGTYILFGGLTYIGVFFVWFFLPETKGHTLEEMDIVWGDESRSAAEDIKRMARINEEIGLTRLGKEGAQAYSGHHEYSGNNVPEKEEEKHQEQLQEDKEAV